MSRETLRDDGKSRVVLDYQPLGVVGAIAPWNSPLILATQIAAQALVSGNSVIVKPSPFTPLTTLRLGEIKAARTLPRGLFNTLSGGNELGQWMTEHRGIDKIGFVGSVATGKRVLASAAASNLKRVSLELGGFNDAAIVLDDADIDSIALPACSGARSSTVASAAWPSSGCLRTSPSPIASVPRHWRKSRAGPGWAMVSSRMWSWDRYRIGPSSKECWP